MSKTPKCILAAATAALACGLMMSARAEEFRVPWVLPASMGWVSPMVDREGNTVLLGQYVGQNLIPHIYGPTQFGDFTLPPLPAGNLSACIAKVDAHGSPLWLRALVTSSLDGYVAPAKAALTGAGEIVFAGSLHGSVSMGGVTLSSQEHGVPLIVKLRQDGEVVWARTLEASADASAQELAIDPAGNIVVSGQDSGGGSGFLAKFSDEGQLIWLRELPKAPGVLAVDPVGNLYLGGQGQNGMQFGAFTLVTGGVADAYAAKYSADGTCQWLFGCGSEVSDSGWGLTVNREGYCYLAATAGLGGSTATTVTVGNTTIQAGRSEFSFVVILNPDGEPHAVVPFEGPSSFSGSVGSVAIDRHGNAVVLGTVRGKEEEPATTLQIGDKSLSVNATLNSALFAANIGVNGECNWLLPLSRWHNTDGTQDLYVWSTTSPAMGPDDSMLIAGNVAGVPKTLGTQPVTGPYLARIDLPVINPSVINPSLEIAATSSQLQLSWPLLADRYSLQSAELLEGGLDWQDLTASPVIEGTEHVVTLDREQGKARFFRLRKP